MDKEREQRIRKGLDTKCKSLMNHKMVEMSFQAIRECVNDRIETGYPEIKITVGKTVLHIIDRNSKKKQKVYDYITKAVMEELRGEENDESNENEENGNQGGCQNDRGEAESEA